MIRKTFTTAVLALAALLPVNAQFASAPAFPGAEGYGRYTSGGRGGKVYHVTSLEDDLEHPTEGMLRYYISKKKGPRIIVFDVAGTIELKGILKINKGSVSVLGQTAPGNGICLKNYTFAIGSADNVIVRFIRSRVGDVEDADAMSASHHDLDKYGMDGTHRRIIIDHCSMSWSTDEVGSFYGNKDFTLQWCILSESLRASAAKGTQIHGFGGIWGGERASFHHNLLADNDSRMPRLDHGYVSTLSGPVDVVNNVIYNWGNNSTYGGETMEGQKAKQFNICNNYYKPGPATQKKASTRIFNPTSFCKNCNKANPAGVIPAMVYINGNIMEGCDEVTNDNLCQKAIKMDSKAELTYEEWKGKYASATSPYLSGDAKFDYKFISMDDPKDALSKVVQYAGASLSRDKIDIKVCNGAKKGTASVSGSNGSEGGLIDSADDAGGWPALKGKVQQDTDGDGMPDKWEKAHGLNPDVDDSAVFTLDPKQYYTNIEVYANSLVEDIMKAGRANCKDAFEEYYPELK